MKAYFGIALEDLLDEGEQTELKIYLHEMVPFSKGEISIDNILIKNTVENKIQSEPVKGTVELSKFILAEYLAIYPNKNRPSVHIGEQVMVISYDESTNYRWFTLEHDHRRRKTELVRMFFVNKDEKEEEPTADNSYVVEVDTREGKKRLLIQTNNNMGEPFVYTIELDTVNGTFTLMDDVGNVLNLKSSSKTWVITNGSDSIVMQPDQIDLTTKVCNINASSQVALNTPLVTGPNIVSQSGITNFDGNIKLGGGASAASPYTCPSGVTHKH